MVYHYLRQLKSVCALQPNNVTPSIYPKAVLIFLDYGQITLVGESALITKTKNVDRDMIELEQNRNRKHQDALLMIRLCIILLIFWIANSKILYSINNVELCCKTYVSLRVVIKIF